MPLIWWSERTIRPVFFPISLLIRRLIFNCQSMLFFAPIRNSHISIDYFSAVVTMVMYVCACVYAFVRVCVHADPLHIYLIHTNIPMHVCEKLLLLAHMCAHSYVFVIRICIRTFLEGILFLLWCFFCFMVSWSRHISFSFPRTDLDLERERVSEKCKYVCTRHLETR